MPAVPQPTAKPPVATFKTEPRFKVGDAVLVAARAVLGHCRTPLYLRGKTGIVVAIHGTFHDSINLSPQSSFIRESG